MWWAWYIVIQVVSTFVLGYIVGLAAAHAKNATAPKDDQTHVYSSALSTAIVIAGVPLIVQLLLYIGFKTPKLMGFNKKLFRYD